MTESPCIAVPEIRAGIRLYHLICLTNNNISVLPINRNVPSVPLTYFIIPILQIFRGSAAFAGMRLLQLKTKRRNPGDINLSVYLAIPRIGTCRFMEEKDLSTHKAF